VPAGRARIAFLVVAAGLAPLAPAQQPDDPRADRLRLVQQRRAGLEREVNRLRGQEKTLLGQVEQLDLEVALRAEQLRETQLVLQRTNAELDQTIARAGGLETELARLRPQLRERARELYKLGELSYVRLLLSVEDPADLMRGYRFVTTLARRDRDRFAAFRDARQQLEQARAQLEVRTREALRLRTETEQARRQLDRERQRKNELLTRLVERKENQAALLLELEEAEGRLSQLVAGLEEGEVSVPVAALRGSLPWPVEGRVRSSFGRHKHPRFDTFTVNNGVEVEARQGTPVFAVHEGTVAFADRFRGYGTMVVVDHGGKHHSLYAHLDEVNVSAGERVAAGQLVGTVGSTGLEGPGLYFEVRFQGKPEDPLGWLVPRR
jgi:septal ring factor EnvC (AmiA/AmiB activator)